MPFPFHAKTIGYNINTALSRLVNKARFNMRSSRLSSANFMRWHQLKTIQNHLMALNNYLTLIIIATT